MSVTTTTNRAEYVGNSVQTTFPYAFKIFANTDLQVFVAGVLKTLTTDYTVSGVGSPTGGDVIFTTAPANGAAVLIIRVLPETQQTVYPSNDKFPAKVHEDALDRAVMILQQHSEVDTRALKLLVTSLFAELTVPDPVDGRFLRWKSDLSGLENAQMTLLGSLGIPVAVADGGTGGITALAARQNLKLDGAVVRQYTNRTGGTLNSGDVVAISTANDESVILGDTVSSKAGFAVCLQDGIANLGVADFCVWGVVDIKVTGTPARGQFLRKSNTSLVVEDAGVAQGAATDAPAGALAYSLAAVSGGKARSLFFGRTIAGGAAFNPVANQVFGG